MIGYWTACCVDTAVATASVSQVCWSPTSPLPAPSLRRTPVQIGSSKLWGRVKQSLEHDDMWPRHAFHKTSKQTCALAHSSTRKYGTNLAWGSLWSDIHYQLQSVCHEPNSKADNEKQKSKRKHFTCYLVQCSSLVSGLLNCQLPMCSAIVGESACSSSHCKVKHDC